MATNDIVGLVKAILSADTAEFTKKFDTAADDVQKLAARLKKDLEPSQRAVNNAVREFLGGPEIQRAETYARALDQIGNVAQLTAKDQAKVNTAMHEALAHYRALGQETTDTAQKYQKLADATAGATKSTGLLAESWQKLAAQVTAGVIATKAIGFLTDLTKGAFEAAGTLVDLREKTGLSLEYLQRLQSVAIKTGTTLDTFTEASFKLGVNLEKGGKEGEKFTTALEALGLTSYKIRGMLPEQQLHEVLKALGAMTDVTERNRLGFELFGKNVSALAPALREYAELLGKAKVATDKEVESLEAAGDRLASFWNDTYTITIKEIAGLIGAFEKADAGIESFGRSFIDNLHPALQETLRLLGLVRVSADQVAKAGADIARMRDPTGGMGRITADVVAGARPTGPTDPMAGMAGPSKRSELDDLNITLALNRSLRDGLSVSQRRAITLAMEEGAKVEVVAAAYKVNADVIGMVVEASKKATAQEAKRTESLKKSAEWLDKVLVKSINLDKLPGARTEFLKFQPAEFSVQLDQFVYQMRQYIRMHPPTDVGIQDWTQSLMFGGSPADAVAKIGGQIVQASQAPARQFAEIWGQSISTTAAAFEGLSRQYPGLMDSGIGAGFAGGLYGAQVGLGAAAQFKAGGAQGGLEGRSQQILAVLQGIMAMQAATSGEDRMGNIIGGAMTGASLGTMLPTGWGTAIGAIAGGAWGAAQPTDRQARQLREEINREVGGDRSGAGLEQMVKDVGAESERYGLIAPGMAGVQLSVQMRQFKEADTTTEVLDLADDIKKVLQDQIEQMAEIDAMLGRYGLSMDDLKTPQEKAARGITKFTEEWERLKALGFGEEKIGKAMASSLNEVTLAALEAGEKLPEAFRPLLQDLARSGGLSDELKNKLLGIPETVKAPWQEMQAIAAEFGIGVEFLGTQFQQSKLTDQAGELARKFELLVTNGADAQIVIDKMGTQAQEFTTAALKWGLEVPVTMRPLLEKLAEQGKLTDENGEKLTDLSKLKFGKTLADELDPLLKKLDELIEVLSKDLPDALGTAGRAAANTAPGGPASGAGTRPDVEPGGAETPGFAAGSGGLRNFRPAGSWAVLHGREEVLTESQGAGVAAMVRSAISDTTGGRAMNINLVMDGRVAARVITRYLPDAVREFKV